MFFMWLWLPVGLAGCSRSFHVLVTTIVVQSMSCMTKAPESNDKFKGVRS